MFLSLQVGSYLGSGIMLSTAFIHLLLPASEFLSSPCLPAVFGEEGYPAWAFLICTIAIIFMQVRKIIDRTWKLGNICSGLGILHQAPTYAQFNSPNP